MKAPLIQPFKKKFSSILIFGPPGVGKGTLGRFLADAGTQYHLSSGDIFRSLASTSPAGELYYSYASKGLLLPDKETIEIWRYYVDGLIATNSFFPESQDLLLDGIPRTLNQAKMLEEHVQVKHVILINISNTKELLNRVQGRARQEGRVDDIDPSILKKRLDIFQDEIAELTDYYPPHLITRVDGGQKPLEVLRDVLVRLSHLLSTGPAS